MAKEKISAKYRGKGVGTMASSMDLAHDLDDVVDFTIGDPDLTTPEPIIRAAMNDALAGHTHYTPVYGDGELIDAIVDFQREAYGIRLKREHILVTASAGQALWLLMETMLDEGDEVLVIEPYFFSYTGQIEMAGGVPVYVPTDPDRGFVVSVDDVRARVSEKTKALIVNSPNNPTGTCLPEKTLRELYDLAVEKDFFIVADDVYTAFSYERPFVPLASFEEIPDRVITLRSFSKNFAMTGWRIGYMLGDEELIRAARTVNENNIYTANTPAQRAGIYALRHRDALQPAIVEEFKTRCYHLYDRISRLGNVKVQKPQGAFYVFMDIRPTGCTEEEVWERLIREAGVLTIPGSGFGESGRGFLRLAATVDCAAIDKAFDRIEAMDLFKK